ncbi:MAG: hypothetical protein FJX42_10500 [Alphaproteobacteria bacterium]|nr:hypothetical protein [Alphaproteobacteria bacterium]
MNNYWNWAKPSWKEIRHLFFGKPNVIDEYINNIGTIGRPYPDGYPETFKGLYALHSQSERISKIKFWAHVLRIYFRNFLKFVTHSKTLFIIDLLFPSAIAGYSLYLGRDQIHFVLARIF